MKIYTLTCHDVYNYGASLQAFALQKYLTLQGHDTSIIDYKPTYLNTKYRLSWYVNKQSIYYEKCKSNKVFRLLYVLRRYFINFRTISRKKSFDSFTEKYLSLSKKYCDYIDLCQNPPQGDLYIVGSDQVWNNKPLLNGWDAAFFLQFGDENIRRISFAASLGSSDYCPDIMKRWIDSLDAISIREYSSKELLKTVDKPIEVVCDPVFLLNKKEWIDTLYLKEKRQDYVLIYNLSGDNTTMIKHARIIAEGLNLKIHYLAVEKNISGVINIHGAGPKEFLEEILNAKIILSDSFHATAFSIIFQKHFFTYQFKNERGSIRMKGLLEMLSLEQFFNPKLPFSRDVDGDVIIDYEKTLDNYINHSKQWLDLQLKSQ